MSIANENNRVDLVASGGQATFAYNFKIEADDEIAVYLTPDGNTPSDATDMLTLTTDYTLTGVGDAGGGNIVLTAGSFPTGAGADDAVVAVRAIDYDQPDAYVVGQDHAESLESSLDRMTMKIQRLEEIMSRVFASSITNGNGYVIPEPEADKVLGWNTSLTALENVNRLTGSGVASNAVDVNITDSGGYFTAIDVEAMGQEIGANKGDKDGETLTNMTIGAGYSGGAIVQSSVIDVSVANPEFGSIPSWAKRIVMVLSVIKLDGGIALGVRLGDADGIDTTTSYVNFYQRATATSTVATGGDSETSFNIGHTLDANGKCEGVITLTHVKDDKWIYESIVSQIVPASGTEVWSGTGTKVLDKTLDRIHLIKGSGNWVSGQARITYEG